MKRREFFGECTLGCSLVACSFASLKTCVAADERPKCAIDSEELAEAAYQHFIPGKRTCSEAILMAACEALGIDSKLIPDIAIGLAGGIGLQGDACGILTSSAMVLSLAVAGKEKDYAKKRKLTAECVGRMYREFEKEFGHADCRSLCGLDLTTPEGRAKLMQGVKAEKCAKCVKGGAVLLAKELQNI